MLQQIESQAMLLDVDESSDILAIFRSAWPGDKQNYADFFGATILVPSCRILQLISTNKERRRETPPLSFRVDLTALLQ